MVVRAKIQSLYISTETVSIRVSAEPIEKYIVNIRKLKDIKHRFTISPQEGESQKIHIQGRIKSLSVKNDFRFVIHVSREDLKNNQFQYVTKNIANLIDKNIYLIFYSVKEKLLMDYLHMVSEKTGMSKEEILTKASSFTNKDGIQIPGKDNIFDLSDRQIDVVIKKLEDTIKTGGL